MLAGALLSFHMRTVLCTGSRGWEDEKVILLALESIRRPFRIIVGEARGADKLFWAAAEALEVPRLRYDAKWKLYGKGAGTKRNTVMLNLLKRIRTGGEPSCFVMAAWDLRSTGTLDMMDQSKVAGFDVLVLSKKGGSWNAQ